MVRLKINSMSGPVIEINIPVDVFFIFYENNIGEKTEIEAFVIAVLGFSHIHVPYFRKKIIQPLEIYGMFVPGAGDKESSLVVQELLLLIHGHVFELLCSR